MMTQMLNKCEVQQYTPGEVSYMFLFGVRFGGEDSRGLPLLGSYQSAWWFQHTQTLLLMLKVWADKIKDLSPVWRDYMSCPSWLWESVSKEGVVSWEVAWSRVSHIKLSIFGPRRERVSNLCCALSTAVSRDRTSCRSGWAIIPYLRLSHPSSHRRKCLWQRPGAPRPHAPPRRSHSRCELHPPQNCRQEQMDKTKWKGESKSAIPENDLLTLQMLHGEREKGKRKSRKPPISFLQAVGMNRGNFDSFGTAASLLPPTKRSWTTLQPLNNPVHFVILFEVLLLHRRLSSHLRPFLTPYRLPLAYPRGSHTRQSGSQTLIPVPFCICGTLQHCCWMPIVDPSHWTFFLWNTKVVQETSPGRRGLELFPMPTVYSRHLLPVQFLFSRSLFL